MNDAIGNHLTNSWNSLSGIIATGISSGQTMHAFAVDVAMIDTTNHALLGVLGLID